MLETIYQFVTKCHVLYIGIGLILACWLYKIIFYDIRDMRKTKKPEDFIKE